MSYDIKRQENIYVDMINNGQLDGSVRNVNIQELFRRYAHIVTREGELSVGDLTYNEHTNFPTAAETKRVCEDDGCDIDARDFAHYRALVLTDAKAYLPRDPSTAAARFNAWARGDGMCPYNFPNVGRRAVAFDEADPHYRERLANNPLTASEILHARPVVGSDIGSEEWWAPRIRYRA
jgi:hypothetical protein